MNVFMEKLVDLIMNIILIKLVKIQKKENGKCKNEYGCLNNKFTKYFSLKNRERENFNLNEFFSFCESDYSDENGVCKNLTLNERKIECDDNINK